MFWTLVTQRHTKWRIMSGKMEALTEIVVDEVFKIGLVQLLHSGQNGFQLHVEDNKGTECIRCLPIADLRDYQPGGKYYG